MNSAMVPNLWAPLETNLGPLAPEHLSEVVAGVILMLVVFFIIWKFVVPAFEKMYAERTDQIQGGMQRAEKAQQEAEQALAEYRAQLADAREEAARIREDAKNQGAQIIAEMRDQATEESNRILEQTRAQLEAERSQVAAQLKAQVGGLATTLAGKIVGESLQDDQRARNTVDRFLADLEQQSVQSVGGERS